MESFHHKGETMRAMKKWANQESMALSNVIQQKSSWAQMLIPPALLSILTALVYYPSLWYPFQFDDIANIEKKFAIRFDNPLSRWWTNSRWFGDWLNTLNFQVGRFDPFSYRLVNVSIHILTGLFVFLLIFNLCKMLKKKPFIVDHALLIASTTMALFLLHPVQTQTVSYVIQARIEGLAVLFVVAALYFFIQMTIAQSYLAKGISFGTFGLLALLSCGTKEIVVVLPLLVLLIDWFFVAEQEWSRFKVRLSVHAISGLFFFAVIWHYLGTDTISRLLSLKAVVGNNRGNIITLHPLDAITPFQFLISQFKVVLHYLFIFIWPFGMSVEYDWKLAHSFFSFDCLIPFIVLASLIAYALRLAAQKTYDYVAFGILWFFLSIAPRSTIIPSPELLCDYKTYLASVGMMFLLSLGIVSLFIKIYHVCKNVEFFVVLKRIFGYEHHVIFVLLFILLIPVSIGTVLRNQVWRTCVDFWQDNAKKAPRKARVHNNLGVALSEAGKIDESIEAYKKAIELDKYYQDPLSNIAVAYSIKGEIDKAIESLQAAIHIAPNYPEAYNNLGSLLIQKKEYADAERMLQRAIDLRPYYGKAYYNFARMYEEKQEPEKVWEYLKKASEGDLDLPEVFEKLGHMSLRLQKYEEAARAFETVLARGLHTSNVWFNLANSYFMLQQFSKAEAIYERLVRDNPLDVRFAYNLAETYFSKKEYEKALAYFRKSTNLPKPLPQAFFRVAKCLENLNDIGNAKSYLNELLALNTPDEFKKAVQGELTRIAIAEKFDHKNNSIKLSDLNQVLAQNKVQQSQKS